MFKKALVVLLLGILAVFITKKDIIFKKTTKPVTTSTVSISPSPKSTRSVDKSVLVKESKSVFVPYWVLSGNDLLLDKYDRVFYFGVTATSRGLNTGEVGYRNLPLFVTQTEGRVTYLTLRLLDDDANVTILKNPLIQDAIIKQTLSLAKENGFTGLVLDLEMKPTLDDKLSSKINGFVHKFYTEARTQDIKLALAIYGDTFYRKRPFDVLLLSKNSDEILIMAYDFHKSRGEPGPNFPLSGHETYGYDFKQMITEFSQNAPKDHLSVIFGMFGYDWKVDESKRPLKPAKALSLEEIKKEFLTNCQWKNCLVNRDPTSGETEVDYVEEPYQLHIVWFEDEESVKAKSTYLKEQGIGSTAYWVYGYF